MRCTLAVLGMFVLTAACSGARGMNAARMPGVIPVVDSSQRDRWGIDGYRAAALNDGVTPTRALDAWCSDSWEVTHCAALVFPVRVRAASVRITWWDGVPPRIAAIEGRREGAWVRLGAVGEAPGGVSSIRFEPVEVEAIRVVQPPNGAAPRADRRLRISEFEVNGTPTEAQVDAPALAASLRASLRDQRRREDAERVRPQIDLVMRRIKPRGFMGIVNAEDRARGRRNVETRPWARAFRDGVVRDADWWVGQSDAAIRELLPEGNPRALCPNFEKGCPIHGGARRSFDTTMETPYRWRCKQGGEWWYDGAVVKNPGTGQDVVVRDDGSGFLAPAGFPEAGRRYYFVAAYRYYRIGRLFDGPYEPDSGGSRYQGGTPVTQLALAYALTGEARYARKAAAMLTRLADLYPGYDGCVEGPTERQDGYIGQTFERFLVQNLLLACDLIWDELDAGEREHVQRHLVARIYEYLHRLMPYFDGDFLMYEMTALAELGTVFDNPDIVAEAMESDTGLRVMLTNSWFRDGKFVYDSCGYNVGNAQAALLIAEHLHGYVSPPRFPRPVDVYNAPEYRVGALFDFLRRVDCDGRVPPIGDGGGGRMRALELAPPYRLPDERALLRLPSERAFYAGTLEAASAGDLERFRSGRADWWLVFHAGDPIPARPVAPKPPVEATHLFPDSGIAVLRAGSRPETREHAVLTFSKGAYGHGHRDKLAINLIRYGFDMTADIGYPSTWTDIKCGGWETNTASHCTVMLDGKTQNGNSIGAFGYHAALPLVDVVEASAEQAAYPSASLYRRTVALVRDERGEPLYTFDAFRTAGAAQRDYLFHSIGRPEDLRVQIADPAARWTSQPRGSLAGEGVAPMSAGGYGFLFDVSRCRSDRGLVAEWSSLSGYQATDTFLVTRSRWSDCTVEFTMRRNALAGGANDRAFFVFACDPGAPGNRCVLPLAGDAPADGRPVQVRIDVRGAGATLWLDGVRVDRRVEAAGSPAASGAVGFLHYYNYGYDYSGFKVTPAAGQAGFADAFQDRLDPARWVIGPTYEAGGGRLRVSDATRVAVALHLVGAPGREIIRARAEGPGIRGQSPFEAHLIARDVCADPAVATAFVAVQEVYQSAPQVRQVDPMQVARRGAATGRDPVPVAARVQAGDRTDYVFSAIASAPCTAELDGFRMETDARFALVTVRGGAIAGMACVGGSVSAGGRRIAAAPTVRGRVAAVDAAAHALRITVASAAMQPRAGALLVLRSAGAAAAAPAVYRIVAARREAPRTWRVQVDMPLVIARGVVASVDPAHASFASRTPVGKLRFIGGFEGKCVSPSDRPGALSVRLRSAAEQAFVLATPAALRAFQPGGAYVVLDAGAGDEVEIVSGAQG